MQICKNCGKPISPVNDEGIVDVGWNIWYHPSNQTSEHTGIFCTYGKGRSRNENTAEPMDALVYLTWKGVEEDGR